MSVSKGVRVWTRRLANMFTGDSVDGAWQLMCVCENLENAEWVAGACDFASRKYEFFVGPRPDDGTVVEPKESFGFVLSEEEATLL